MKIKLLDKLIPLALILSAALLIGFSFVVRADRQNAAKNQYLAVLTSFRKITATSLENTTSIEKTLAEVQKATESRLPATIDIYVVDDKRYYVSNPKFLPDAVANRGHISTAQVDLALQGLTGEMESTDYRGVPVLASYQPMGSFAIIAEIDKDEALSLNEKAWYHADRYAASLLILLAFVGIPIRKKLGRLRRIESETESVPEIARTLIRLVPIGGVCLVENDGRIVEANSIMARLAGFTFAKEVIGRNVDMFHREPSKHKAIREGFDADINERKVTAFLDGKDVPILLTVIRLTAKYKLAWIRTDGE